MSSSSSSSSMSSSLVPVLSCRQCVRLMDPDPETVEQLVGNNVGVFVSMAYSLLERFAPYIPNAGPDTLVVNYTDDQGQPGQMQRAVRFWMSDSGYVFLSSDLWTQFYIAGVNGTFFDTNAVTINARNVTAGASPLLTCCNPDRYDMDVLLANQVRPTVWIYDGSSMVSGQT